MKGLKLTILIFIMMFSLVSIQVYPQQTAEKVQQTSKDVEGEKGKAVDTQAEKRVNKSVEDLGNIIKERMDKGESMFDIIGVPELDILMPSTPVMVVILLIPLAAIVGFIFIIRTLIRNRHEKIVALIESGTYNPEMAKINWDKINWRLITLLMGCILSFGGLGLSLFTIFEKGSEFWYTGIIPVFLGIAFFTFQAIANKK